MAIDKSIIAILRNPHARRVWVAGQLRLQGTSLGQLAKDAGVCKQAVSNALMVPSERLEKLLAKTLGLEPKVLFPERYDRAGNRTCRSNPNAGGIRRNAKAKEAA